MACDLVVAAEGTKLGEPEIRYGSAPVTLLMPYLIGQKKTRELLLTGDLIDAVEAERIGLVNRVVPADRLAAEVDALADRLARTPPEVMAPTKAMLNRAMDAAGFRLAVEAGLDLGAIINAADTPEQREWDEIVDATGSRRPSPGATAATTSGSPRAVGGPPRTDGTTRRRGRIPLQDDSTRVECLGVPTGRTGFDAADAHQGAERFGIEPRATGLGGVVPDQVLDLGIDLWEIQREIDARRREVTVGLGDLVAEHQMIAEDLLRDRAEECVILMQIVGSRADDQVRIEPVPHSDDGVLDVGPQIRQVAVPECLLGQAELGPRPDQRLGACLRLRRTRRRPGQDDPMHVDLTRLTKESGDQRGRADLDVVGMRGQAKESERPVLRAGQSKPEHRITQGLWVARRPKAACPTRSRIPGSGGP